MLLAGLNTAASFQSLNKGYSEMSVLDTVLNEK